MYSKIWIWFFGHARKATAIKLFVAQYNKLPNLQTLDRDSWRSQTIHYVTEYLGPQSHFLEDLKPTKIFIYREADRKDIEIAKALCMSCIETIQNSGVFNPIRSLFGISYNVWATGIGLLLASGIFYQIGFNVGETRIYDVKDENKLLKDSIVVLNKKILILYTPPTKREPYQESTKNKGKAK